MLVVSSKEFRERQASYFDCVDNGEEVLVQRGNNKSYKIVPVVEDDTLMSEEEFFAKIDRARQEVKDGKGIVIKSKAELKDYFEKL